MTRIVELDERNMMVTAEAGVRTIDLYDHCAAKGLFFPPDPASWKFSTIGGNVAENAGGMQGRQVRRDEELRDGAGGGPGRRRRSSGPAARRSRT